MLAEFPSTQYSRLRELVKNLAVFNVILDAVINDTTRAWVTVDQTESPSAALLFTAEGAFLVGNAGNQGFVDDLRAFFYRAETEPHYWRGGPEISVLIDSSAWEHRLPEIFPRRQPVPTARHHYLCTARKLPGWRECVPYGFSIERIELPHRPGLVVAEHVMSWIHSNWDSVEDFAAHGGFAFAAIHQNAMVSWSVADAIAGNRCEIGIRTLPAYRRRGLAALTTMAAVDYALASGLGEVGWHCSADNIGSIGTALKAGFHKERDYIVYRYSIRDQNHSD